jgi:hypothetical protein
MSGRGHVSVGADDARWWRLKQQLEEEFAEAKE